MIRASLLALWLAGPAFAQGALDAPLIPAAKRAAAERLATDLARQDRRAETDLVLDVLRDAGHDDAAMANADKLVAAARAKVKKGGKVDTSTLRALKDLVKSWEACLVSETGVRKARIARLVLRLDHSDVAAEAAGYVKGDDGKFLPPGEREMRRRKGGIQEALAVARKTPIDVVTGVSEHPLILAVYGKPGRKASVALGNERIELNGMWSEAKLARVLRESMRLYTFSTKVANDAYALPLYGRTWTNFDNDPDYKKAIAVAQSKGWIDAKGAAEAAKLSGFEITVDGVIQRINIDNREGDFETSIFLDCSYDAPVIARAQPCLRVGHMNWATLTYLGEPLPGIAWIDVVEGGGGRRTGRDADGDRIREEYLRLGKGGVAGARAYLAWLASRREDPAWANAMVDQIGKIEGLDKLKTTFAVEFIQELGEFKALAEASQPNDTKETPAQRLAAALGTSLAEFEESWRDWIGPKEPLAARLGTTGLPPTPPPEAAAALVQLNHMRAAAFAAPGRFVGPGPDAKPTAASTAYVKDVRPTELDLSISDGCRKHARYLAKHKDQAAAWPDAHEEWPDREGFTPEGATAAANGVIAPGVRTTTDAMNGWMATFYHRLPLLDPGLMRIGFGLEDGVAVLDCASFVAPTTGDGHVIWPYDGMTDVPLAFEGELPNPVPGIDERTLGYPVTLQLAAPPFGEAPIEPTLELREGNDRAAPMDAHVSTPSQPTNPVLAPAASFCLMTKAHLKPRTTYFASAIWPNGRRLIWKFTTGSK